MSLFTLLLLASCALAQSSIAALQSSAALSSNSCLKRSVVVYTSDSSTYLVTDIGTSNFQSTPTFCANASISTVTTTVLGPSQTAQTATVTVYQSATSAQVSASVQPSTDPVVANNSFENGASSPFNSSASMQSVTAEVVQGGIYEPHTGDNYLLINFNGASQAQGQVRRQSTAQATPLVYNVTQMFAASAGTSYTLTAWAAVVITGDSKPNCFITICGDNKCSLAFPLTVNYTGYSYNYESPVDETNAVATFQTSCMSPAYVALDDVSVVNSALAASSSSVDLVSTATTTVFRTETVVQSQAFTQIETTAFISGSEVVLTTTVPTIVYMTATVDRPFTETRTVSTLHVSTATATTAVPQYVNVTVSSVSTTTTTLTSTINSTVISYQPSLVVQTEYATSTALFTTTQPGLTLPASTYYQDPSTAYVTLDPSTVVVTLQQPVVTVTPEPVTLTSIADAQTSLIVSYMNVTQTLPVTLPQETAYITPSPVTDYVTLTLEPITTTIFVSVTLPPLTEIQTFTLPPGTETLQVTETLPQITETLPQITQTQQVTQYGPTITETYVSSEEPSYSSIYVPPPPSGVPAVALARPTAIVGNLSGSPISVDDRAYSVSLPVNLTLYGQSSANVRVSSNSLIGLTDLNWEYVNTPLPYYSEYGIYPNCLEQTYTDDQGNIANYCFGDAVAFGLWDDLYIYQGTQQGIYYEVDGVAPHRRTSFEFYISHISDSRQYYHFLMNFWEDRPNVVNYQYLNVSDHGISATVGVQCNSVQQFMQYSFNQAIVCPGLRITLNTTLGAGSYTVDDPGNCSVPVTPVDSSNNGGEPARIARTLKARPDYRGDTADYPGKGL